MNKRFITKGIVFCMVALLSVGAIIPGQGAYAASAKSAKVKNVKNVIMLIPDGMSVGASTLARYMLNEKGDIPLTMDEYVTAMVKTRWANGPITDSAPAATALATGNKSISGALGIDENLSPKASLLEAAQMNGKATGIIATSEFMHATPAAYTSHEIKRSNYAVIAEQMLNQNLDVMFGTGASKVDKSTLDIIATAESMGYTIIDDRSELNTTKATKVWGNFMATIGGNNNLSYDLDRNQSTEPSLAEMTSKAIEILNKDKDGFFLMVEGSKIDRAAHANDTVGIATDVLAFDKAFKAAVDFAKKDGNTLVISVTDHGNSGITIGNTYVSPSYDKDPFSILAPLKGAKKTAEGAIALLDATKSEQSKNEALKAYGIDPTDAALKAEIQAFISEPTIANLVKTMNKKAVIGYTTGGHTGEDVPLYVCAPSNVELPKGVIDNTEVAAYIADAMGVDLSKTTSKLFVDITGKGTFDSATNEFTINASSGKVIKVKPNQSTAYVDGKAYSLDGQITVYINNHFYAPQMLVDLFNAK